MKNLRLSNFKWFKKGKIHHEVLKMSGSKKSLFGKYNEKLMIFDAENKRHVTMMTAKDFIDFHLTYEDRKIPQENFVDLRLKRMVRYAKGVLNVFKKDDLRVITLNDKIFEKSLVDIYSSNLLNYFHIIQDGKKLPPKYIKKIKESKYQLRRKGANRVFVFNENGSIFGTLYINYEANRALFLSSKAVTAMVYDLTNFGKIIKKWGYPLDGFKARIKLLRYFLRRSRFYFWFMFRLLLREKYLKNLR